MDKAIKEVLNTIENHGFEAYVVGGYVRDYLRGISSTDIDICTNAKPKDLNSIFKTGSTRNDKYGAYKIVTDKFSFDITTYRKELKYFDRRPAEIEYVNNLITDLERRDFTINSLCMKQDGIIIDYLNGSKDINEKRIRVIGDLKQKLSEDPLRMLRAIRFGITLDFTIDKEILEFIKSHRELLNTLSNTRKKYELDCILVSSNALKGMELIKELDICKELGINYEKLIYMNDIAGMWAQIEVVDESFFTKSEKKSIVSIKEIVAEKKIDNFILYKYGLYLATVAGKILGIDHLKINEMYQNLPIKTGADIVITYEDIINTLNITPCEIIKKVYQSINKAILTCEITNEKSAIIKYISDNRRLWLNEEGSSNII